MKSTSTLALLILCTLATAASAQSAAGQDGKRVFASGGVWQCTKVRFPNGATSGRMLVTGTSTVCASGSCSNAPGNANLYVYGSTVSGAAPARKAAGACVPNSAGNEEACTIGTATADWYYWMCIDTVTTYNEVQIRAEYNLGSAGLSNTAANSTNTWFIDYWKNNLFLGIAYHRFGCLANNIAIVSEREYDGFTATDYCRLGQGLGDPATRGGESTYMNSTQYTNWTLSNVVSRMESCGTSTNTTYNTPDYARRSGSCSYNVMMNCNSDCWIKKFSACERGTAISILSPCW